MDSSKKCIKCGSSDYIICSKYNTKNNGIRDLYKSKHCKSYYSETSHTFMFNVKTS